MIRLYTFPDCLPGTPDPSGFVVKLMTIFSLAGIPYTRIPIQNPSQGPKGKVPFIEDNGVVLGDTTHILEYLHRAYGLDLDLHLSALEKAQSHALQRLLEERLYWVIVYSRWMDVANQGFARTVLFKDVPWPIRGLITRMATKTVRQALHHQGLGRHTGDEIYQMGLSDINAVRAVLDDKPFLFGDRPSVADATAFGMLINIAGPDVPSPLRDLVHDTPSLFTYLERMHLLYAQQSRETHQQAA